MKVTLVKPNMGEMERGPYIDSGRMEPLQLGVIAALTPPDIEVVLYDDRMEAIPYDEATDLVAITAETFTARRAYQIADEFRQRRVPVILGGMHPSLVPAEAAAHADSVFLGDAESLWAAFTLGYDDDTVESVHRTLEFALENKFCFAAFNILTPYPGTAFYRQLAEQGRLLYDGRWWLHPDYRFNHAAFRPMQMTPAELSEACFRARAAFSSVGSIARRALDFRTNMRSPYRLAIYLRYNPLFRKEVFKKHGLRLGLGRRDES